MELLWIVSGLATLLASLVIGARLLWLGWGSPTAPESLLGLALFSGGAIAFPLSAAASHAGLAPELRVQLGMASYAGCTVMLLGKAAFVWTVFRRTERWAAAVFGAFCVVPVALLAAQLQVADLAAYYVGGRGPMAWNQLTLWLCDLWATVESFRYFGLMRRRRQIGLADALVTDRFLLFGLANGGAVFSSGVIGLAGGIQSMGSPLVVAFVSCVTVASGAALWLAFLPPERYRSWVLARA